jgi:nicotinate-nucleotide--dimethylbenzimidazole phosphoribosyltransferase
LAEPDLAELAASIVRPDEQARMAVHEHLDARGLDRGRLDELAGWLGGVQAATPPRPLRRVVALSVATGAETAATARLADGLGVAVRQVPPPAGDARACLQAGRSLVDDQVDSGADLLVVVDASPASDVPAAALVGLLARRDAWVVTCRGATIDDAGWMGRCAAVRDTMRRARPALGDQTRLLDAVAGAGLAVVTGVLLQAAARRTPVLLDGVRTAACALVAHRVAFRAVGWWLPAHLSPEPAHSVALDRLGLEPVLDLGIREEDGTGPLLAVPVLRAAADLSG